MAKKNVIRPDAASVIVRILCWLAILCGIALTGYSVFTAVTEQQEFLNVIGNSMLLTGIGLIVGACILFMIANIADDLKTLRVNEYGIQGKTREFRNEVLDRMHVAEQENMHLIRQQDEIIQRLKEFGDKPEGKTSRRSAGAGVRISETPKEEETDYELDLH